MSDANNPENTIPHADETRQRVDRSQSAKRERMIEQVAARLRETQTGRVYLHEDRNTTMDTVWSVADIVRGRGYKVATIPTKDDGWMIEICLPDPEPTE